MEEKYWFAPIDFKSFIFRSQLGNKKETPTSHDDGCLA